MDVERVAYCLGILLTSGQSSPPPQSPTNLTVVYSVNHKYVESLCSATDYYNRVLEPFLLYSINYFKAPHRSIVHSLSYLQERDVSNVLEQIFLSILRIP